MVEESTTVVLLASVSCLCKGLGLSTHLPVFSCTEVFIDSSLSLVMSLIHCQYCFDGEQDQL